MSFNTWTADGVRGKVTINMDINKVKYVEKHRELLEKELNVKIGIDKTGQVIIEPKESTTLEQIMKAKEVLEAINYGFDINTALELKKPNYVLMIVDLRDYVDKSKINHLIRIRGRIIGEEGRARRTIEELSGTKIVISDKAVAIIGEYENTKAAREAIELLIRGRQHATVYRRLQSWRKEMRRRKLEELVSGTGSMFREDIGIEWKDVIEEGEY